MFNTTAWRFGRLASVLRENERRVRGGEAIVNHFTHGDPTRARYLPVPSTAHLALQPIHPNDNFRRRPKSAPANLAEAVANFSNYFWPCRAG
jgi:hypothetical protein